MATMSEEAKVCGKCDTSQPLTAFTKASDRSDGLSGQCRTCQRAHHYRRKYGISIADYDLMFAKQGGRCAICGTDDLGRRTSKPGVFHIDHCHDTGKVRGLLCGDCNTGLGCFKDDTGLMQRAQEYLNGDAEHQNP